MITVCELKHHYPNAPKPALNGISFNIAEGDCIGLLGPNGAGKTTLISLLSGLQSIQSGSIAVNNTSIQQRSKKEAQTFSVIPQDFAFYPRLTVWENMCFFASLYKKNSSSHLKNILNSVGLIDYLKIYAKNLSGGLKRRLNFAIGLINDPKLIFMDEPTVGVDPESRQFILDCVLKLLDKGTTVVYTSHYLHEIEAICQQVIILDLGTIRYEGAIQNILQTNDIAKLLVITDKVIIDEDADALHAQKTADQKGLIIDLNQHTIIDVIKHLEAKGYPIVMLNYGHGTLEAFYLNLLREQRERSL